MDAHVRAHGHPRALRGGTRTLPLPLFVSQTRWKLVGKLAPPPFWTANEEAACFDAGSSHFANIIVVNAQQNSVAIRRYRTSIWSCANSMAITNANDTVVANRSRVSR